MNMRKDAGAALIALAHQIGSGFAALGGSDTVWNIGNIVFKPGAANVVPSESEMTLEVRDTDVAVLDRLEEAVSNWVDAASKTGSVRVAVEPTTRILPTMMSRNIADAISAAAAETGTASMMLPSGAGHDAMVLGRVIPAAMLFVPSIDGRSHDVTENTADVDIVTGCRVLAGAVGKIMSALA
jgi:N-carbamoyl-L-amino-acid hydrolase